MVTLVIPQKVMEKYNAEKCYQITFTKEGLDLLTKRYRNVRGLPAFLHNTLRGRQTPDRDLILENCNLYAWASDLSAIIMPNYSTNWLSLRQSPRTQKDNIEGLTLVVWAIDPRVLAPYGLIRETGRENIDVFREFLLKNDNTKNVPSEYRHFHRTNSQEVISTIEMVDRERPYLASILDLTPAHIPFLKNLKDTSKKHLTDNYGIDFTNDRVEMYFHFPYPDFTTTLHLHIRVNHGRHPMERARSFTIDEIITCLEKDQQVSELILNRNPYYSDNFDILQGIEGVSIRETQNPFILNSAVIEVPLREEIEGFFNSQRAEAIKKTILEHRIENSTLNYEQRNETHLDPNVREELKANPNDIMCLVATGITLDDLLKLNPSVRTIVIECSSRVVELVEQGVEISQLNDMNINDVSVLLKMEKSDNANTILTLLLDKKTKNIR